MCSGRASSPLPLPTILHSDLSTYSFLASPISTNTTNTDATVNSTPLLYAHDRCLDPILPRGIAWFLF